MNEAYGYVTNGMNQPHHRVSDGTGNGIMAGAMLGGGIGLGGAAIREKMASSKHAAKQQHVDEFYAKNHLNADGSSLKGGMKPFGRSSGGKKTLGSRFGGRAGLLAAGGVMLGGAVAGGVIDGMNDGRRG